MSWKIGTVECQCRNVMGMPTDTGVCTHPGCQEKKTVFGENTLTQLEAWAKEHSATHQAAL